MKMRIELVPSLMAIVLLGTATLCSAQTGRQMGGVGITVFVDRDFRGTARTFHNDVPDLRSYGMDNRISSLRIGPGEMWEVCAAPHYRGGCVVVSGDEPDLRRNNWNDKINSLRRFRGGVGPGNPPPGGDYIVFFNQTNFRGSPTNFSGPVSSLNRRAQSVTIGGVWQLCDGRNFTGRCITLENSTPDLGRYGLRNRVGSARPVGSSAGLNPPGSMSDWYVVLFDQPNYRGNPTNFNTQVTGINRPVGSVTIGKGVWEFCDGNNFTGRCVTLNNSVSDLRPFNIGSRIASLRPLTRQPR